MQNPIQLLHPKLIFHKPFSNKAPSFAKSNLSIFQDVEDYLCGDDDDDCDEDEDEESKTGITTEILPFTPLIFEIWVCEDNGVEEEPKHNYL